MHDLQLTLAGVLPVSLILMEKDFPSPSSGYAMLLQTKTISFYIRILNFKWLEREGVLGTDL